MNFTVEQLAALVPDGASITLHKGDEPDVPMRLGMALIRRGVHGHGQHEEASREAHHGTGQLDCRTPPQAEHERDHADDDRHHPPFHGMRPSFRGDPRGRSVEYAPDM